MWDLSSVVETAWRLGVFLGVFAAMTVWEVVSPRRRQHMPRIFRWSNNLGIVLIDALAVRLTFPVLAVGIAIQAHENSIGLFNWLELPVWITILTTLVIMDFAIYWQHRLFHSIPGLWRLHRMHHADLDFDVTTGIRFHPVEIVLSMGIKLAVVALIGAPPIAVLAFEILLNATSMFNHGNVRLPLSVDKALRRILVTPDMHRIHHSVVPRETNSNFGFNLPWWDKLLGTYRDQPIGGHDNMTIGLQQFRTRKDMRIDQMLIQPLR